MRNRTIYLLLAGIWVAAAGCASHGIHQAKTHVQEHGMTAISYPESHRIAFLKRNDEIEHLCAGPGIDAVSSTMGGLTIGVGGVAGSDEKIGNTNETVETGLGGRDPAVLIAREILFRTCETIMNHELSPDQAIDLYKVSLDAITSIAQSQTEKGTAAQVEGFMQPQTEPQTESQSDF